MSGTAEPRRSGLARRFRPPSLRCLPPDSPKRHPVENVRACLRATARAITHFNSYGDIVEANCQPWNFFANDPAAIAFITARDWAEVS